MGKPDEEALGAVRYQPLGLLGEGGMGRVEHAWDADLMRHVAIKRLKPELADDAELVQQFLWEARVSAYLDHPNIAPVHDLGTGEDGQLYFTMPRVGGVSLATVIARLREGDREMRARFPLPRRLRLFTQVAQAVSFAHARGVLHRDLKPNNVMLGEHGEVRVMDWGLAVPLPGPSGEPLRRMMPDGLDQGGFSGTPLYMSPEQARGETLDAQSDVYSLGVMLYELASLARPFSGRTVDEVVEQVQAGRVRPLARAWPEAPPSLRAVIERAMAFRPAERYPSAAELAAEVELICDGHTPRAEHASFLTRFARFYTARDPAMARLHVWEIDMWAGASFMLGIALGAWKPEWFAGARLWMLVALALLCGIPPTLHWMRARRKLTS